VDGFKCKATGFPLAIDALENWGGSFPLTPALSLGERAGVRGNEANEL
jgi:hypothetical protein